MKTFIAILSLAPFIGTVIMAAESGVGVMVTREKLTRPGKIVLQRIATASAACDGAGFISFGLAWILGAILRLTVRTLIYAPTFAKFAFMPDPKKAAKIAQQAEQMNMAMTIQSQAVNSANQAAQADMVQKQAEVESQTQEMAEQEQQERAEEENKKEQEQQNIVVQMSAQKNAQQTTEQKQVKGVVGAVGAINSVVANKPNAQRITSARPGSGSYSSKPYGRSVRPAGIPIRKAPASEVLGMNQPNSFEVPSEIKPVNRLTLEKKQEKDDKKISSLIKDTFTKKLN